MSEPAGTELLPPLRYGWVGEMAVRDAHKQGRATVMDTEGREILVLENEEIRALEIEDRQMYLRAVRWISEQPEVRPGQHIYRRWIEFYERCTGEDPVTGERCTVRSAEGSTKCSAHLIVDKLEADRVQKRRAEKARLRMADLLEAAVDTFEDMLTNEDVPISVRYKAAEAVLDRAGVPKRSEGSLHIEGEVVHVDASSVIAERLDSLRDALTSNRETSEIEGTVVADVADEDD